MEATSSRWGQTTRKSGSGPLPASQPASAPFTPEEAGGSPLPAHHPASKCGGRSKSQIRSCPLHKCPLPWGLACVTGQDPELVWTGHQSSELDTLS